MRHSLSITIAANFQSFSTLPASSSSLILSVITWRKKIVKKTVWKEYSAGFVIDVCFTAFTANIYHLASIRFRGLFMFVTSWLILVYGIPGREEMCNDCREEHWKPYRWVISVLSPLSPWEWDSVLDAKVGMTLFSPLSLGREPLWNNKNIQVNPDGLRLDF